jgi:mitochondrial import inner membrane translocase subunit TIM50
MLSRVLSQSLRVPASSGLRQWVRSLGGKSRGSLPRPGTCWSSSRGTLQAPGLTAVLSRSLSGGNSNFSARKSSPVSGSGKEGRPELSRQQAKDETGSGVPNPESAVGGQAPQQPLPDLTRGIPSTLEYETTGSTTGRPGSATLNLTEDPASPGEGRARGELPASAYISSSERNRLRIANYMYAGFAISGVLGYIYLGRNWESDDEERLHSDAPSGWSLVLMWKRARARLGDQLNYYKEPAFRKLLPDPDPSFGRPYTLVLSLEDLLVHSEWSREHGWRMAKRPGVDYFLRYLGQYYELVIFTTVPWAIGEPVIRKLDPYRIVTWPLFREATMYKNGEYIKVQCSLPSPFGQANFAIGSIVP